MKLDLPNPKKRGAAAHGQQSKRVAVRIPISEFAKLQQIQEDNNCNMSILLQMAITAFLEELQPKQEEIQGQPD